MFNRVFHYKPGTQITSILEGQQNKGPHLFGLGGTIPFWGAQNPPIFGNQHPFEALKVTSSSGYRLHEILVPKSTGGFWDVDFAEAGFIEVVATQIFF